MKPDKVEKMTIYKARISSTMPRRTGKSDKRRTAPARMEGSGV